MWRTGEQHCKMSCGENRGYSVQRIGMLDSPPKGSPLRYEMLEIGLLYSASYAQFNDSSSNVSRPIMTSCINTRLPLGVS